MNIHENARSTPRSRATLVNRVREQGWSPRTAAQAAGISVRKAYKWLRRHRLEGDAGLRDRRCRAHSRPHALPKDWCDVVVYLRQFRQPARRIAEVLGMARSTVSAVLSRNGLGPQASLEPPQAHQPVRAPPKLGSSCTSTRSALPASIGRVTGLRVVGWVQATGLAGSSYISRSTTSQESPTPRSSPMKRGRAALTSCGAPATGSNGRASTSAPCSPTTGPAIAPTAFGARACRPSCAITVLAPTRRAPTAKPSGSSNRCFVNGRTVGFTEAARLGGATCLAGFTSTMRKDAMPASVTFHPPAGDRPVNNGRRNHT